MFLVGLTGGIASGKTTVASRLVELGAHEIDADLVAREVVEPGTKGLAEIVEHFGKEVLDSDGTLNRSKLAQIVFTNETQRKKLEAILHPLIQRRTKELIASQPKDSIVVYSVPLLVEANVDYPFDYIVTVEASPEIQIERLQSARGMDLKQAQQRLLAQASPEERALVADKVIDSSKSKMALLNQVDELWNDLRGLSKRKNN